MISKSKLLGLVFLLTLGQWALASPPTFTYQGRIINSNGLPLENSNVSFEFIIANPAGTCVLYREQKNGLDMRNSKGVFDTPIGTGAKYFPTVSTVGLLDVFSNSATLDCEGGSTYTPVADDGRLLRVQFYDGTAWRLITPDNVIRSVPYASFAKNATTAASATRLGSNVAADFVLKSAVPVCAAGYVLTSTVTGTLTCTADTGGTSGAVNSIAGSGAITVTESAPSSGVYTVAATTGTTAGTLAAGNDSRFTDARTPTGGASGDLTGSYPAPTIANDSVTSAKILDGTIGLADLSAASGAGQTFRYSGTAWTYSKLLYTDLVNSLNASPWPTVSCSAGQFLTWVSTSDSFACTALTSSMITTALTYTPVNSSSVGNGPNQIPQLDGTGKLDASVIPSGASAWTVSGSDVYRASGNVGVGTTTPARPLHVMSSGATSFILEDSSATTGNRRRYMTSNAGAFSMGLMNDDSSVATSHMRIDNAGNVGIGMTATAKLDVAGATAINSTSASSLAVGPTGATNPIFQVDSSAASVVRGVRIVGGTSGNGATITVTGTNEPLAISSNGNQGLTLSGGTSNGVYIRTGTTTRMTLLATNGYLGIGTASPSEMLEVNGSVKAVSFISTSDRRLKKDIEPAPGYSAIKQLEGVQYNWISNGEHEMGLIAQEVEKVFPFAVATDKVTGYKGVKYQALISPLIQAVKETHNMCEDNSKNLQAQVDELKKDRDAMKNEIAELKKLVRELASEKNK